MNVKDRPQQKWLPLQSWALHALDIHTTPCLSVPAAQNYYWGFAFTRRCIVHNDYSLLAGLQTRMSPFSVMSAAAAWSLKVSR